MPGGLLNIIAYGNANIILNGNPSKTFFKTVYAKHTNFGMQKFRIDYDGSRDIDPNNDSVYTFKIPRNAELLMDTYLVFGVPDIWSTILPPLQNGDMWKPYQFKWNKQLGTSMIKNIQIFIGAQMIQEYDGQYIRCMAERDYNEDRKKMFDHMTGNVIELNEPQQFGGRRLGAGIDYPNAFFTPDLAGPEPSIRGRKIYVPLASWFSKSSKLALPLVCLQYSEVVIKVTLRPIYEMFTINNVVSKDKDNTFLEESTSLDDSAGDSVVDYQKLKNAFYQRIQPNFTVDRHQLYRFLQPPPNIQLFEADYQNKVNNWNADVHLIANYGFLTMEESNVFALNEQRYLIKEVKHTVYHDIVGTRKVKLDTNSLVCNWMWFYRRSDVYKRNEWSNYTNWPTSLIPYQLERCPNESSYLFLGATPFGPGKDPKDNDTGTKHTTAHHQTPIFSIENQRNILNTFAIMIDGKYRENELDSGVFNYIEKFRATNSSNDTGIFHYNFCLDTTNYLQPTGAMNLNRFRSIEFEMNTILPPFDPDYEVLTLCDENGGIIGVTKEEPIHTYTFDMHLYEEKYNILRIMSGNGGLLFAH